MTRSPRRPLASVTSRLVVTTVALMALVCLLLSVATTLAMRNYLSDRLDEQVRELVEHDGDQGRPGGPGDGPGRFTAVGTIRATFPEGYDASGFFIDGRGPGRPQPDALTQDALAELREATADGTPHQVGLSDLGSYRVVAEEVTFGDGQTTGVLVLGLPTAEIDETLASLIGWEVLLSLLGLTAAGTVALLVVRRQLRPLREVAVTAERVAELQLSSGDIEIKERVPERLTDEATEVGQVGAALNTLLEHVEASLAARHRSEQQVRQFVADASHELRTPLTTIKGYAELSRRRPDDRDGIRLALDKVEQESARMTTLVEDLLLLARLDSGRPLERAEVDLTKLLLDTVSDARVLAPSHQWRLDLPEEAVMVAGDEQRLHQVVTNLLTNARKYTPEGTTVTVATRRGDRATLTVHDDGPGFPPELAGHAFERFVRGDAARARTGEGGAGLGLSLVEAIVEAHGGAVALRTRPGDTTVSITLP